MATSLQPEELAIQHMRERSQWMPVTDMNMREKAHEIPWKVRPLILPFRVHICRVIVVVNEIILKRLSEDCPCNDREAKADTDIATGAPPLRFEEGFLDIRTRRVNKRN